MSLIQCRPWSCLLYVGSSTLLFYILWHLFQGHVWLKQAMYDETTPLTPPLLYSKLTIAIRDIGTTLSYQVVDLG